MNPQFAKAILKYLERDLPMVPREINEYGAIHRALREFAYPPKAKKRRGKDSTPDRQPDA